ncbi:MAG: helix-turn-helix transcriptional regulator [Rhodanobacteraceae bacterium]
MSERLPDETLAQLAALIAGDRWLDADGCAAYLGGIKRRTFLEKIAPLPDFPAPARIAGAGKLWRKSDLDAYLEHHKLNRAA